MGLEKERLMKKVILNFTIFKSDKKKLMGSS